jgi:uncharacterized protein YkwD
MRTYRLPLLTAAVALLAACGGGGGGSGTGGSGGGGGGGGSINSGTGTVGGLGLPPLYVLLGGSTRPAGADIYLDSRLAAGEVFIMTQDPLATNHTYTVAVAISTGTESFNNTWTFTTGTSNLMTSQSTPLAELNALRAQSSSAAPFTTHTGYVTAAVRHAGYQSEFGSITHGESDSSKRFFVNNAFDSRIVAGCTAAADPGTFGWGTGINLVGEDIASNGGVAAIAGLWNTVYHRLPMMRSQYSKIGIGDRVAAAADPLNSAPQVIVTPTTTAFLTLDFGGASATAQIAAQWPMNLQGNVYSSFNTDSESPDPIGGANGTPTDGLVGVPIHIILPTTHDFTSLTITVTP